LIARQRKNLQKTFVFSEQADADSAAFRRLAKSERELAEATAEFTEGLQARFGPIPCLREAREAMTAAAFALEQSRGKPAQESEEAALAGLIKARQNIRQLLNESQSASACRKFDQQQKQKLRKPEQEKKDDLAKILNEIEKLAKEEGKIALDLASRSGGASSDPNGSKPSENSGQPLPKVGGSSDGSAGPSHPSPEYRKLIERQEKAAQKSKELQERMAKDEAMTGLARERMDSAAGAIDQSAKNLQSGREREAGKQAAEAADQLERLSRQVAALKAADLANQLAAAQGMARQLSREQQALSKGLQPKGASPGDSEGAEAGRREAAGQRGLSEEARTLEDLLRKIQKDSVGTNPVLGRALEQATETNPPQEIVRQMGRAANALQVGKTGEARRDVDEAAQKLDSLARQIEAARRAVVQPQLDKLLAAEKQAAEAAKALESVKNEQQKAEAEKKLTDLRDKLEALGPMGGKVSESASALGESMRIGAGGWRRREGPLKEHESEYAPPVVYQEGLNRVIQALQAKIQEVVLRDALLDRDEPVPPQYKSLVEEYYRLLSDDLR
jgi:hypothetical protein